MSFEVAKGRAFKLGLIVNPVAGVGGSVALKGSDGVNTFQQAIELGAIPKAAQRTLMALERLVGLPIDVWTIAGAMGEQVANEVGLNVQLVDFTPQQPTTAEDTKAAVTALIEASVDFILFAGGDGTARNICDVVGTDIPVLGIPAGVKIHSGVYAVTPAAAGELIAKLVAGELISLTEKDVRDIDEEAFRQGVVRAKFYGEMNVPSHVEYVQHTKEGGKEVEALVLEDIAADFQENMEEGVRYVMGSGTTVAAVMDALGIENTLLGVDVIENGELIAKDCSAKALLALAQGVEMKVVITIIGGQGHIIGRGNQQLSAELLQKLGKDNVIVLATKSKLKALEGRPLIVDSDDSIVNHLFEGVIPVVSGYRDVVLYRVTSF
ncbi:MAG: ATP-NAD kinase family protein [Pontibacterium sp.]